MFPGSEPLQDSFRKLIPNVQTILGPVTHAVTQFEHRYSAKHHFTCGYTHSLNTVTLSDTTSPVVTHTVWMLLHCQDTTLSYTTSPVVTHTVWTLLHCQTQLHLWLHIQFERCYTVKHHFTCGYSHSFNVVTLSDTTSPVITNTVWTLLDTTLPVITHTVWMLLESPKVTHKSECCYRHHFAWGHINMLHCRH